ncbi:MAG: polyprenol monophosphomannose synthase [Deltaproteobacteria bacterium]|nr:polyprenol monophosphomannose synthase [Deltaproteobacteria bacterium]
MLIIPTYQEAGSILSLLAGLRATLPAARLLVVDDQSPDGTADLVLRAQRDYPRLSLRLRSGPRGLREAVVEGMGWALDQPGVRWVGQLDADGSHPASALPPLLDALQGADLALGCRYMPGGGVAGWAAHRRALSWGGNRYARAWLGLPLRDLTGGLKLWRAEALRRVAPATLRSRGYAFQIELGQRAALAGLRVVEVPFVFTERRAGRSKMSLGIAIEAALRVPALRLRPWTTPA